MIEHIGRVLHNLRVKQGLSMSDVARCIDVSRSFISQIEKGQTHPSLDTLEMLSKVLNAPLSRIFEIAETEIVPEEIYSENEIIVRKDSRRVSHLPEATNLFESLTPPDGSYMEFFISTLNPYKDEDIKYEFCHDGQEYCYVTKGPVEFHLGSQQFILETGDSCCFDASIKHYYLNRQTEAAYMVCAIPPTFAYTNHLQLGKRVRN